MKWKQTRQLHAQKSPGPTTDFRQPTTVSRIHPLSFSPPKTPKEELDSRDCQTALFLEKAGRLITANRRKRGSPDLESRLEGRKGYRMSAITGNLCRKLIDQRTARGAGGPGRSLIANWLSSLKIPDRRIGGASLLGWSELTLFTWGGYNVDILARHCSESCWTKMGKFLEDLTFNWEIYWHLILKIKGIHIIVHIILSIL